MFQVVAVVDYCVDVAVLMLFVVSTCSSFEGSLSEFKFISEGIVVSSWFKTAIGLLEWFASCVEVGFELKKFVLIFASSSGVWSDPLYIFMLDFDVFMIGSKLTFLFGVIESSIIVRSKSKSRVDIAELGALLVIFDASRLANVVVMKSSS